MASNYYQRVRGDYSPIPNTQPDGDFVAWDCVADEVRDGIRFRRMVRLVLAGASGDPKAVEVLEKMETHPRRDVADSDLTETDLRAWVQDMLNYCDEVGFTNEDEAAAEAAAIVPAIG